MVTMKQMGLNVASDPLMSVAYIGVKGGLVIVSADDPGPISSQTEQDTRRYADFCRIPVFDPASPEEAYQMIQDAFAYSEKYNTPVLFRPTTRVCHAYAAIETPESFTPGTCEGFERDTGRWVIFPRLSYMNHGKIEKRNVEIGKDFSSYRFNTVEGTGSGKAVVASGVSYNYVRECLKGQAAVRLIRVATAFPFPEDFMLKALEGVQEVLCVEELSPYLEEQILKTAGKHHLDIKVSGKLDGSVPHNGENGVELCSAILDKFLGIRTALARTDISDAPALPVRPPVLCAGCPHRASFYAVKQAMKGQKAVFCGDIGCYTLGNAMPLDRGGHHPLRPGQLHHRHDRPPAPSRHRPEHDGQFRGQGQHRKGAGRRGREEDPHRGSAEAGRSRGRGEGMRGGKGREGHRVPLPLRGDHQTFGEMRRGSGEVRELQKVHPGDRLPRPDRFRGQSDHRPEPLHRLRAVQLHLSRESDRG